MAEAGRKQILIVEDNKDVQTLLQIFLKRENYEILVADGGRQALQMLRATERLPDLILLDVMMSDMDAYEFREEQSRNLRLMKIPVIVMSAHTDVQKRAIDLGAKAFLRKPFSDVDKMLETIGRALL